LALRLTLAPYACDARQSRGRLYPQAASPSRSEFQRDRDRIIHCSAFRRLAHKTQVFVSLDGDHFRTRLTHSIEVGQISRALARALGLDEDLAETVALAHDLGHTPFGHAGETALTACMAPFGGFDHNAQALRVVTMLERRYALHDGLNLTFEALEGIVKHNGPLAGPNARRKAPAYVTRFDSIFPLELTRFAGLEAQAAAIADDIAYNAHDIDDGLRAGLFQLDDIAAVPHIGGLLAEVRQLYPGLEQSRVIHELQRRVITGFVEDVIAESEARIGRVNPASAEAVRNAGETLVGFSPAMAETDRAVKKFLFSNMYRHPEIAGIWERARDVISRLFPVYFESPDKMSQEWAALASPLQDAERAAVVADYIAGMTDRFALHERQRLFGDEVRLG
jgi:dGTPase